MPASSAPSGRPTTGVRQRSARARKRSARRLRNASPTAIGSHWLSWLGTMSSGPSLGTASSPSTRMRPHQALGESRKATKR
jgi:hypothetical protein